MICSMSRSVLIKEQTAKKVSIEVGEQRTDNNALYALLLEILQNNDKSEDAN